ncbi:MAG: hypothetical protein JST80_08925 [Bdellovibrionales bacterium]|nr:hypothetical protein [Bdellovibrionales bacterium]
MRTFKRAGAVLAALVGFTSATHAAEINVYQVYRSIDLGESETLPPKDIFISAGSTQGVKRGAVLDVYRRISSFDNLTQKHMGDHMIPVGRLKVIHVDEQTAIARLDKFVSTDSEPALLPQAVMIGDVVRLSQ